MERKENLFDAPGFKVTTQTQERRNIFFSILLNDEAISRIEFKLLTLNPKIYVSKI